jgi:hypothetical protein
MNTTRIVGSAFALALLVISPALAQQSAQQGQANGSTSGPAAGRNVAPSAATQRKMGA